MATDDDLSGQHFDWLVEGRSHNQKSTVALYKIIEHHAAFLEANVACQTLAQDLSAVAFSLWRAVFLSDLTGDFGDQLADLRRFLQSLLAHNTVLYQTDFNSREWAFNYYLDNALLRLDKIATDAEPQILSMSMIYATAYPLKTTGQTPRRLSIWPSPTSQRLSPSMTQSESAHDQDGRRLQHAEGTSRPLHANQREAQPRAMVTKDGKRVDHAEAAKRFLAAPEHLKFHDERLWDMRKKRDRQAFAIDEWEELRELASKIKEHTLTHLDTYLEQFEAAAKANGVIVHWAKDGAEHNAIVLDILRARGAATLIKSKSMLTEECGMREHLTEHGIIITETDLGERIQQLDKEAPSHVVVPSVHKLRSDVAEVFARTLGTKPDNDDPHYLAESQRMTTRPLILAADAGLTGGNFIIAETGAVVTCTNEGNADLSANTPDVHIVSVGIEKLIPRTSDLGVFIRLLSRSALGSPITQYTSHFRAARAGAEMHVVLVDNGRSARLGLEEFWTSLKCIRCGACMNTCPVYRRSGGLSYGFTYTGPLGLVIDPTFDKHRFSNLPFASTLNGSCTNVCPTKINLHEQIYAWREVMARENEVPLAKKTAMQAAGVVLSNPRLYRAAIATADSALASLPRFATYNKLNAWGRGRENPEARGESFHLWWAKNRAKNQAKDEAAKGAKS